MSYVSFSKLKRLLGHFWRYWITPIFPLTRMTTMMKGYARYLKDWCDYVRLPGAESHTFLNSYPCLGDKRDRTPFDAHYFYQGIWAAEKIASNNAVFHIDIGSDIRFVGQLSACKKVILLDIRPLSVRLRNFCSMGGDLCNLPFAAGSCLSISCLHVAEHVGLGRYGDLLNPAGTRLACQELVRILAPGGDLYFSLPIGESRLYFNAHRVLDPLQVLDYFIELQLFQFACVTDFGEFIQDRSPKEFMNANYACGLFHFRKNK